MDTQDYITEPAKGNTFLPMNITKFLPEKLKRNTKKERVRKNKRILGDGIELRPEGVELREEFGHSYFGSMAILYSRP